jgi:hypothetical protein
MAKRTKRRKRGRREPLVHQHLENVSRDLLEQHPDVVQHYVGSNAGIYALYRKDRLYYVGLATGLRGRLKAHLKNRHSNSWDRFSIYLTIKDQHLREIEALLLRISNPEGAKQRGRLSHSKDIQRRVKRAIREKRSSEDAALFGKETTPVGKSNKEKEGGALRRLLPQGAKIRGTLKGKIFSARVRRNGQISFKKKLYGSLSLAAVEAIGRPTNGWWFWQVERGKGNWVRLRNIRKVGTPLFAN